MVRITSLMSPSVSLNRAAARSTSAAGGVSLTNRRTSFVAMKRAVDGCAARMSSTCSPSLLAAAGLDPVAEHQLLAAVVQARVEDVAAALARIADRPAGERARDLGHVLLRVAAVDAQRVQLHQLAAVVLVQPSFLPVARPSSGSRARTSGVRIGAHPVVEIEQHRRTLRRRFEQIAELAEDVRPDRVALVGREQESIAPLPRVDVEMVEPEIGEHFLQLPLAVDRAKQLLLGELGHHLIVAGLHLRRWRGRPARRRRCRRPPICARAAPAFAAVRIRSGSASALMRMVVSPASRASSGRIGDSFRPKLLVDVALKAERREPCRRRPAAVRTRSGSARGRSPGRQSGNAAALENGAMAGPVSTSPTASAA